ncbi:nickel-dependent hydrogenase large subunit [Paenibacillus sp. 7124]|uniref:Nickel-dependent hydrogenase large subunit n=1 Tax=Paenibacillus apii TaxID=1850370 RepID=A0A6M1PKY0_9BACL|nr:nickel-dependent hydrogenase large subunit [Paenibacillus apii]NGM84109.1 nickel-dependent hydrogenase large subunit [Paenibacillus apii]NJJ38710.1 nickel-dependent hydrogenase large subunit [Paenibacillus apii]
MSTIKLDPVTRLEGHLKVEVTLGADNTVASATVAGMLFRDFENMLLNRPPRDASFLTQRICGVCPVPQAVASSKAVEKIKGFKPNLQGLMLRNLIQGANFLDSGITHFYHLSLLDYIQGPQMSPWTGGYTQDLRFSAADTQTLTNHYLSALQIRRKANEMAAIFSGKLPHAANIVPGGVTALPSATEITNFRNYLNDIQSFISSTYQSDVNMLASAYSDYYNVGTGYGNLITFGVFDTNTSGGLLFPAGTVTGGTVGTFNEANIKEYNKYSYYSSPSGQAPASGTTTASYGKSGAYTWLKSPRYNDTPFEAGPLARVWVSGDYRNGVSVMDRHMARYVEMAKLVSNMQTWLDQLTPGASGFTNIGDPVSGSAAGLTEAPRGAIGHWLSVSSSKISKYQIITPTCWNASPMDDAGNPGPVEKALIGTQVADPTQPVELLRIVHSFDPCTGCSVHVMSPDGVEMSKFVVQPLGK